MTKKMEQPKDEMIKVRSTIKGKNSKGGDRTQYYLTPEDTQVLINELTASLNTPQGQEKGVKLDLHTNEKQADDGRKFLSSFGFVKSVGEGVGGSRAQAPRKFAPKPSASKQVS